jgi:hypothetical protein
VEVSEDERKHKRSLPCRLSANERLEAEGYQPPWLAGGYEEIYKPYAREILKLKQAVREAKERRKRK